MKKLNNLKLKQKIALIYIVTGMLPLVVMFLFSYNQLKGILTDRDMKNMQSYLNKSVAGMDSQFQIYDNLSNYISFNETITNVLNYDYKSSYDKYEQLNKTFDPMLSSLKFFHDDINQVTIYIDDNIRHDSTIRPLSEIANTDWYKSVSENTRIQWFADNEKKTLFSARKMSLMAQNGKQGILYINIGYDNVFDAFSKNIDDNYGIMIIDNNSDVLYDYDSLSGKYVSDSENIKNIVTSSEFDQDGVLKQKGKYMIIKQHSDVSGWDVYMYEPNGLAVKSADSILLMIVVSAIVAIAAAVLAIFTMSKLITRRVEKLLESMKKVEHGDFDVHLTNESSDEIGDLIHGFNTMTNRIDTLINEVYKGKISQKEYEMKALRAQINPHFLYNSLSLINWKAIASDEMDISKITLALSNYYRTSLNKGKNTLTLGMEISNMMSYLEIQKMMHDDGFDVVVDIDESLYEYESLNLILQPIVENAIDHGIDLKTDGRGVITIKGNLTQDGLIRLTVEDNGVGMSEETVNNFFEADSKGYGAKNVNERIKLYYGEQYNMHVESTPGRGTIITIEFPARIYKS